MEVPALVGPQSDALAWAQSGSSPHHNKSYLIVWAQKGTADKGQHEAQVTIRQRQSIHPGPVFENRRKLCKLCFIWNTCRLYSPPHWQSFFFLFFFNWTTKSPSHLMSAGCQGQQPVNSRLSFSLQTSLQKWKGRGGSFFFFWWWKVERKFLLTAALLIVGHYIWREINGMSCEGYLRAWNAHWALEYEEH